MDKVKRYGRMVLNMKVSTRMVKPMEKENSLGQAETPMTVNGRTIRGMELEHTPIKMETLTPDHTVRTSYMIKDSKLT